MEVFVFEKHEDELCREKAAKYLRTTPRTLATIDSTKQYDLKPFKKKDGKTYYYRSVLDAFAEADLKP
ncbi:hypothetical protein SAMN04488128_101226 [Chitinophaga eiseniae]|uniref:Helix-turn-helix domain-containing protein n=1 Tax=Chitinophaga eiseniae TaxID=634771 RepID=A0A1T4KNQ4_9BACT|nr:hypothetical protein [Chitinophaga eiseniae]SJZ44014.1 hypothetical protein SAMN04488128_101226 [Chitinophaga eiseniae]